MSRVDVTAPPMSARPAPSAQYSDWPRRERRRSPRAVGVHPLAHGLARDAELPRDLRLGLPLRHHRYGPCPSRLEMRRVRIERNFRQRQCATQLPLCFERSRPRKNRFAAA